MPRLSWVRVDLKELFLFLAAIFLHEMGHYFAAKLCGVPCVSFGFRAGGAVLTFDFSRVGYAREGFVHAGGALLGLLSAVVCVMIFGAGAYFFLGISLVLSFVNLLPITGMDGGAILSCVLSQFLLPDTVWRVQRIVSFAAVLFLWGAVLWIELRATPNFSLMAFVLCVMFASVR